MCIGGELFAKRRKKADKWIVDEASIGSMAPSQFADQFVQQQSMQQQQFQMQQQQEYQVAILDRKKLGKKCPRSRIWNCPNKNLCGV
jgi:1,2-phenylacetyl-CoA epoxidase PaaB subunit